MRSRQSRRFELTVRKLSALSAISAVLLGGSLARAQEPPVFQTPRDKVMYAIGVNVASNLKAQGVEVDLDLMVRGMKDVFAGGPLLLSDEEVRIAIQKYQIDSRQRRSQLLAKESASNKAEGEAFLAANRSAEGVVTLPSGVQYKVLAAGNGKTPGEADTVDVNLRGLFVNGAEFENSMTSRKPLTLKVKEVIPGLSEALQKMPVGSTWKIFVPSPLGYAERGKPGSVGPNATLIYDIELLSIK